MRMIRVMAFFLAGAIMPFALDAGGIIVYEIGSQNVGLASAGWSARADDPSTAFTNPAGMSRLSVREVEFGAQPIYSSIHFDPDVETTTVGGKGNGSKWIPSGGLFYVEPINESWSAGVSFLGYFGSAMKFNHGWVGRYYLTEIILQSYSFVPTVSYRMNEHLSFGFGTNMMYGVFKQKAAVNNVLDGLPDGSLKVYDDDVSFGCILGVLYEFTPCTRVGLQYVSEVKLHFNSPLHLNNVGPNLLEALFEGAVLNSNVLLDSNVPQSVMFSAYHDLTPSLAIMGNVGWQEWSKFQKATLALGVPSQASFTFIPKYQDTWHGAFGIRYLYSCSLAFSAGIAYDSSAVSTANRPLDFPIGKQWRYGFGFEWEMNDCIQVGFQYTLMRQGDLFVNVNRGPLAGRVVGDYKNVTTQFFNLNLQMTF